MGAAKEQETKLVLGQIHCHVTTHGPEFQIILLHRTTCKQTVYYVLQFTTLLLIWLPSNRILVLF